MERTTASASILSLSISSLSISHDNERTETAEALRAAMLNNQVCQRRLKAHRSQHDRPALYFGVPLARPIYILDRDRHLMAVPNRRFNIRQSRDLQHVVARHPQGRLELERLARRNRCERPCFGVVGFDFVELDGRS